MERWAGGIGTGWIECLASIPVEVTDGIDPTGAIVAGAECWMGEGIAELGSEFSGGRPMENGAGAMCGGADLGPSPIFGPACSVFNCGSGPRLFCGNPPPLKGGSMC